MLRLATAAALVIAFAALPARAAGFTPPSWLLESEAGFLFGFGHPMPQHIDYIAYPTKIAVIFEFDHVVICGLCSAPSNADLPRGRIVRTSFARSAPHHGDGTIRFCESRGKWPPRANCLRR